MRSSIWIAALLSVAAPLATAACDPDDATDAQVHAGAPVIAARAPGAARSAGLPDRGALAELLDHLPSGRPPGPTAPDGGTLVGSDSGLDGEELPEPPPAPSHRRVQLGRPRYQPMLSNPAIERAARAQIYWHLRKCTTADGKPPPTESITLSFTLRPDGTVDPATVGAQATELALEDVAECVVRTFSSIPFRGPAAAHGTSPRVVVVWPSVD